jgi:hypothetical protein
MTTPHALPGNATGPATPDWNSEKEADAPVPGTGSHGSSPSHPAAKWGIAARFAAVATLMLGFGVHLVSVWLNPTPHGSDDDILLSLTQWIADNPGAASLGKVLDTLFVIFMVGAVIVMTLLGRRRSPKLAMVGGVMFGAGLVALAVHEGYESFYVMMLVNGLATPREAADLILETSPADLVAQAIFLIGMTLGLILTVVSLWRSRAVPRLAAVLLLAFLVVDLAGLRVVSHLLGLTSMALMSGAILRAPRDASAAIAAR